MGDMLTSGGLAPWGQAAAFILALYLFFSLLVGLALTLAFFFLLAWLREKSEQIKKLRPLVNEINQAVSVSRHGATLPPELADSRLARLVARVPRLTETLPAQASEVEQRVEQGSDRMAGMVIELHARTRQAQGFMKALFLPGLVKRRLAAPVLHRMQEAYLTQGDDAEEASTAHQEPPLEQNIVITQSSR
jgi:hypothetical protein